MKKYIIIILLFLFGVIAFNIQDKIKLRLFLNSYFENKGIVYISDNLSKSQKLILEGAKNQLKVRSKYHNEYHVIAYPEGDVPADEGVCTDVIIRAYRNAKIDLQKLIYEDKLAHSELYPLHLWTKKELDKNIDHRRCPNLFVFFDKYGRKFTLKSDKNEYKNWKPGDIVFYSDGKKPDHVAIISDKIHKKTKEPYIIDNFPLPGYVSENHMLNDYSNICGHFRYPK